MSSKQGLSKPKILTVDDEPGVHMSLALELEDHYDLSTAFSAQQALEQLYKGATDAVILDVNMPEVSGLELLKLIRRRYPEIPVIMLTSNTETAVVVEAIKTGASDYVLKTSQDLGIELRFRIDQAIGRGKLLGRAQALEQKIEEHEKSFEIIGHSTPLLKLKSQILALKGHRSSVLITGESGTGKELVARALSIQEGDRSRKFVAVNCAAIPETIAESELFGHEKGAFTHAIKDQQGKFLAASGGDIFLDEIGELSPGMQSKLLRVLQEGEVTPVGATTPIPIDVRVIAATNKDLREEVEAGRFRQDLYYRISVIPLEIPPLRERQADIPLLVNHFIGQFNVGPIRVSAEALEILNSHQWPGNIRALRNCLERACIIAKGQGKNTISPEHLIFNDAVVGGTSGLRVPAGLLPRCEEDITAGQRESFVNWAERVYYEAGLKITGDNKKKLAELLDVSRDFVHRKLKTLQISKNSKEATA